MLSKAAKNELVREFNDVFKANPSVMVVEYKGLTVKELETLRSNLRKADAQLKVVKNTLLRIAAKDTQIEQINDLFEGPTAVAICEKDATAVAKRYASSNVVSCTPRSPIGMRGAAGVTRTRPSDLLMIRSSLSWPTRAASAG